MSDQDYQGGLSNHFDYTGMLDGRSTVVKSEAEYTDDQLWPSQIRQAAFPQHSNTVEGSEFDTGASSLSPRSAYFSEPSERGVTFSPNPRLDEINAGRTWAESSSVSPIQIKQSPSQSSSSGFRQQLAYAVDEGVGTGVSLYSATINAVPPSEQQYNVGFDPHTGQFRLPWAASVAHSDNSNVLPWYPSLYPQMQQTTQLPYYPSGFVDTYPRETHSSGSNARVETSSQTHGQLHGLNGNAPGQYARDPSRSMDEQTQREVENKMLLDGKAAGLTYKDIRAKMGTDVAESTLRGRYRALTKDRKDRVRKPTWTSKDVSAVMSRL